MSATGNGTADLLAALPGFASARCTPLPTGSNNASYRLEQAGARAVLKVAVTPRGFPLNSRAREAAVQSAAHRAGLAPQVLYVDEHRLLEAWVPGSVLSIADFSSPPHLRALAAALRRLHALPRTGRRFPLREAARRYRATLRPTVDAGEADRHLATVEGAELSAPLVCCHNDVVAGNVIDPGPAAGGTLCLLDWEYAADNDPLFDLATIVTEHAVPPDGQALLLESYFGAAGAAQTQPLERMCRVYRALAWLWRSSRPAGGASARNDLKAGNRP